MMRAQPAKFSTDNGDKLIKINIKGGYDFAPTSTADYTYTTYTLDPDEAVENTMKLTTFQMSTTTEISERMQDEAILEHDEIDVHF